MEELGIYLHWPFCKSKCPYCDFYSVVKHRFNQDALIDEYLHQLEQYRQLLGNRHIKSVFFGGGTPSLITPSNIELILSKIARLWGLDSAAEISLEANPNTNTPNLFADLHSAGINRLSLGVQSFNDTELKFLGRTHNSTQALQAIADMQKYFNNCSIDLIYALPDQTADSWQQQLEKACRLGLNHLSLYQLTIEDGTIFAKRHVRSLDEQQASELYFLTEDILVNHHIYKYEVSNYATQDFSSKHNLIYWQGGEYIGIGKSAHGRFKLNNQWYAQTDNLQTSPLTPYERAQELIIMGLRLSSGINKSQFKSLCRLDFAAVSNSEFINYAVSQNWLENTPQYICATRSGFLILDKLIEGICC